MIKHQFIALNNTPTKIQNQNQNILPKKTTQAEELTQKLLITLLEDPSWFSAYI